MLPIVEGDLPTFRYYFHKRYVQYFSLITVEGHSSGPTSFYSYQKSFECQQDFFFSKRPKHASVKTQYLKYQLPESSDILTCVFEG